MPRVLTEELFRDYLPCKAYTGLYTQITKFPALKKTDLKMTTLIEQNMIIYVRHVFF